MLLHQLLQYQAFACVVQKHFPGAAHLLKYAVGKALEAEHVNIQDSFSRMHFYHVLLGLHGKLLRHNNIVQLSRILQRFLYNPLAGVMCFPDSGTSDNKL